MKCKPSLSGEVLQRLGRPLTPEEAHLMILAEIILEEREEYEECRIRPQRKITIH